jgi:NAD(P)-dependent dehydrogenase (short-subunit alcohol dehydrogenase family)
VSDPRVDGPAPPLSGQAAVVTGAGRGIGYAIAERLVRDGASVVLVDVAADRVRAAADRLATVAGRAGTVLPVAADCSIRADVERSIEACLERFGRLDVFVANAGIGETVPFLDTSDELWDRTMAINLRGVFLGIQAAGRTMRERGGGRIVATASTNAFWMETELTAYDASKAGVVGLVRTAAMELAPYGITVNAVGPGMIATDLTRDTVEDPERSRIYLRQIPAGRFGTPADVAGAVAFLVSVDAAWITGHVLVVDGGQTLGTPQP